MALVSDLAKHISTLQPHQDVARLCLYHYLINLCEPHEQVNSELLNRFFCRALIFDHWQTNKLHLFQETQSLLRHFQEENQFNLDLVQLYQSDTIQAVPSESIHTLNIVVNRYYERILTPYDRFKTFVENQERVVAILLRADKSLQVTTYSKNLAIKDGELIPLCHDFTLFYTPELQLRPNVIQQIEVGTHMVARFRYDPHDIQGFLIRGYTFQKHSAMNGGGLHRNPVLFYPLKRMEQLFINRKTDPMYIELTELLEKALELLNSGHPEALKFASTAYERGKLALENIFQGDKLVRLLISNLEKTIALEMEIRKNGQIRNLAKFKDL